MLARSQLCAPVLLYRRTGHASRFFSSISLFHIQNISGTKHILNTMLQGREPLKIMLSFTPAPSYLNEDSRFLKCFSTFQATFGYLFCFDIGVGEMKVL